jgi:hypothetical protein
MPHRDGAWHGKREVSPMSEREPECELSVGAVVRCRREMAVAGSEYLEYRIEELVRLADGATLYWIKSDAEPFQRVVSERDLDLRT